MLIQEEQKQESVQEKPQFGQSESVQPVSGDEPRNALVPACIPSEPPRPEIALVEKDGSLTQLTAESSGVVRLDERRLDTQRVFLYKRCPITKLTTAYKAVCRRAEITNLRLHDFRHTASTNLRRAGVDTATAMKIVGHKSERMHRRYNTIEPEDLHQAASKLHAYRTNTVITPEPVAVGAEIVST